MAYEEIIKSATKLKAKFGETDPFMLCSLLGIPVCFSAMGRGKDAIKGFIIKSNRIKAITVSSMPTRAYMLFTISLSSTKAAAVRKRPISSLPSSLYRTTTSEARWRTGSPSPRQPPH